VWAWGGGRPRRGGGATARQFGRVPDRATRRDDARVTRARALRRLARTDHDRPNSGQQAGAALRAAFTALKRATLLLGCWRSRVWRSQAVIVGPCCDLHAVSQSELGQDVADVGSGSLARDDEFVRDFAVAATAHQKQYDFTLALAQRIRAGRRWRVDNRGANQMEELARFLDDRVQRRRAGDLPGAGIASFAKPASGLLEVLAE